MYNEIIMPKSLQGGEPERLILTKEQLMAQQKLQADVNKALEAEKAIFAGNIHTKGTYDIMGKRKNPESNQEEIFLILTSTIPYNP